MNHTSNWCYYGLAFPTCWWKKKKHQFNEKKRKTHQFTYELTSRIHRNAKVEKPLKFANLQYVASRDDISSLDHLNAHILYSVILKTVVIFSLKAQHRTQEKVSYFLEGHVGTEQRHLNGCTKKCWLDMLCIDKFEIPSTFALLLMLLVSSSSWSPGGA